MVYDSNSKRRWWEIEKQLLLMQFSKLAGIKREMLLDVIYIMGWISICMLVILYLYTIEHRVGYIYVMTREMYAVDVLHSHAFIGICSMLCSRCAGNIQGSAQE